VPETKKIGVLTSGGDCAGLNAAIRAVTLRAIEGYGWQVFGIRHGTHGLMNRPVQAEELTIEKFDGNILRQGGTVLGSMNRGDPLAFPMPDGTLKDRSDEIIEGYHLLGLDALIGIGGDGSMDILRRIAQKGGLNLIGIPKTIDNDLGGTENSIGYVTAVDVATEALDRLQPTAASHDRVMVLEVMGRNAGHIALSAGISGGADAILIPEIDWSAEGLAGKIRDVHEDGRTFALVMVAEAARLPGGTTVGRKRAEGGVRLGGVGQRVGDLIEDTTGAETRVTVLGHVQRGGAPSPRDRLFASAFGVRAVDLAAAGTFDRLVVWSNRACTDIPLQDAIETGHGVDPDGTLVHTARGLGIYLGG
tara:strand:- start:46810 stop:47895 length:1086 start_codon:yes stop_codon:yes gene_type:complete